jgi:hypothetical protein
VKRSIPYLDGGGGCFSQLASITKHTKETLAIEDNNLLTLSHWCSLRTSNPCQPPPPSSHPLVVYSCYWSETKPHSGKHRKHSSPLPCSRACRQTIICCCQIFVFLDFDSATYLFTLNLTLDHPPSPISLTTHNPRIRPCSKTPVSRITRQLSGTFRRSRPVSRLCKRSEALSGKHFQQFHNNKESPVQRSAGTSHNHRSIDHCTQHAHNHKHDRLKSMPIPTAYHAMLAACLLACLPTFLYLHF